MWFSFKLPSSVVNAAHIVRKDCENTSSGNEYSCKQLKSFSAASLRTWSITNRAALILVEEKCSSLISLKKRKETHFKTLSVSISGSNSDFCDQK